MKTFYRFNIKNAMAFLIILFASAGSFAQDPQFYNYNSTTPTNSFPFNIPLGKEIQLLYLAGDFN